MKLINQCKKTKKAAAHNIKAISNNISLLCFFVSFYNPYRPTGSKSCEINLMKDQ